MVRDCDLAHAQSLSQQEQVEAVKTHIDLVVSDQAIELFSEGS